MELKSDSVQDKEGNVIPGADVLVLKSDKSTPADIFDDQGNSTRNPLSTGSRGEYIFQAENGKYYLQFSLNGDVLLLQGPFTLYDPSDDQVNASYFGAVGDGQADDTDALQRAIDSKRAINLGRGIFKITRPLQLTSSTFSGENPARSIIAAYGCHAFTVLPNENLFRPACIVEKIGISSPNLSCDDKYAFYVPGSASGAAPAYNSGLTVRDVEIGSVGRMGGGFFLKDMYRVNLEDIGMTDVSSMIKLVGSVIQLKARNVTSNNDNAAAVLDRYGISTSPANYAAGTMIPENCRFIDCAYIRGDRGISHAAGLDIGFENFDTEAKFYGAILDASCTVRGGIFAPSGSGTGPSWSGIRVGVSGANIGSRILLDAPEVNMLTTTTSPTSSYGFDFGDGVSPVRGLSVYNAVVRGVNGSVYNAIRGRNLDEAVIENSHILATVATDTAVTLTGTGISFNRNRVHWGTVAISDIGVSNAGGAVVSNQLSALVFAPTNPNNWQISGNLGSAETQTLYGLKMAQGTAIVNNISLTPAASVTPSSNGQMTFELTNDTTLKVRVKGRDGTLRSTTLTLS